MNQITTTARTPTAAHGNCCTSQQTSCPSTKSTSVTAVYAITCVQVACTCLGTSHPMLKGQEFDCCILDEAGQMTLPASLGPLLKARWAPLAPAGCMKLLVTKVWAAASLQCC